MVRRNMPARRATHAHDAHEDRSDLADSDEPARRAFRSSANLGYHGIAVAFTAAVATGECRQLGNL